MLCKAIRTWRMTRLQKFRDCHKHFTYFCTLSNIRGSCAFFSARVFAAFKNSDSIPGRTTLISSIVILTCRKACVSLLPWSSKIKSRSQKKKKQRQVSRTRTCARILVRGLKRKTRVRPPERQEFRNAMSGLALLLASLHSPHSAPSFSIQRTLDEWLDDIFLRPNHRNVWS